MMNYEDLFEFCHDFGSSRPIDVNLSIDNSEVSNFIESLLPNFPISPNAKRKTLDQVVEYLFMVVANIAKAYMQGECVAIPRSSRFLNGETALSDRRLSKGTFITVLDFLTNNRLIAEHRGHFDRESNLGQVSRYWATKNLYEHFSTLRFSDFYTVKPIPPVILHDISGKSTSFTENRISHFFSDEIFCINSCYKSNKFQYIRNISKSLLPNTYYKYNNTKYITPPILGRNDNSYREMLYPSISAVFSRGNFDCGGRLYSIVKRGIGWQNLSQEERHTITINGESTVELDFKALHISMLYAIMGIQIREDPYTYFSTEMRSLYKTLMLRLLNARSIRGTLQSIERTLWTLKRKPFILSKEMKILNAVEKFKPNWNKLVSELMEHHKPIRRFFGSDCGVYLQRLDGEMMLRILSTLTTEGIPALPVHDSVIVPRHAQNRAAEVMQTTYRHYMGFDCIVEAK